MNIRIVVEGQSLHWYGATPRIADDSVQFVRFQFDFPTEWLSLQVTAQFTQSSTFNVALKRGMCFLPAELVPGKCKLSLFGYGPGESLRATTIPMEFTIEESGFISKAETPVPPTPDLYAQLLAELKSTEESVDGMSKQVADYLEDVEDSEANARQSELNAKASENNAKSSETNANTSEQNAKSYEEAAAQNAAAAKGFAEEAAQHGVNSQKAVDAAQGFATSAHDSSVEAQNAKDTAVEKAKEASESAERAKDVTKDWNAPSDSSEHIKNRTHYTETKLAAVPISGYWREYTAGRWEYVFDAPLGLDESKTYLVGFNGVIYQCLVNKLHDSNKNVIGGLLYHPGGHGFAGFNLYSYYEMRNGNYGSMNLNDYTKDESFHLRYEYEFVHKLDEKFLPDAIGRVKTVNGVAPDTNGNVKVEVDGNINVTAQPGQMIIVKSVDKNGKPTQWEAMDVPKGGGGAGGAQSDWNATESEPGHVLNRTHWVEDGLVEILPETTLDMIHGQVTYPNNLGLVAGKEYTVIWKGDIYTCTAAAFEEDGAVGVGLGNTTLGDPDSAEPFYVLDIPKELVGMVGYGAIIGCWSSGMIPMAIYTEGEIVHKLDPKYLPDGVPYSEGDMVEILTPGEWMELDPGFFSFYTTSPIGLEVGKTYIVSWDGTEYTCIGQDAFLLTGGEIPGVVLGNMVSWGAEDTGEPFLVLSLTEQQEGYYGVIGSTVGVKATFAIYGEGEIVHKLDPKFLPEGVPYMKQGFLLDETDAVEDTDPTFGKCWVINKAPMLTAGETYTVIYNGVSYDCVCMSGESLNKSFRGAFAMGNTAAIGGADTGEPFAMLVSPVVQMITNLDLTGATSVKIGIMSKVGHAMDDRCLPDTARVLVAKFVRNENGNLTSLTHTHEQLMMALHSGIPVIGHVRYEYTCLTAPVYVVGTDMGIQNIADGWKWWRAVEYDTYYLDGNQSNKTIGNELWLASKP